MSTSITRPDECDFCSSKDVLCRYPCMDFDASSAEAGFLYASESEATNLVLASKNYWAACATCSRLVEKEDIDGLVEHAVKALASDMNPSVRLGFTQHLRHTYKLFFKNRIRVTDE